MKLLCYFNSIMCRKMEKCRKVTKIYNKLINGTIAMWRGSVLINTFWCESGIV